MRSLSITRSRSIQRTVLPATVTAHGHVFALTAVQSSNVGALGYDKEARQLVVVFKSGAAYLYHHVSETAYGLLLAADSKGDWLALHIIGNKAYPYEKLTK